MKSEGFENRMRVAVFEVVDGGDDKEVDWGDLKGNGGTQNFDPSQERIPAGEPDGGQWTSEGGGGVERGPKGEVKLAGGKDLPEHLQHLRIPPAWKNVRLNLDSNAKLLVKGEDAKGRTQSIYSISHAATQAQAKFERVKALAEAERAVAPTLAHDPSEEAAALRLVAATGIRPGSDKDTGGDKQAYGATTLLGSHVKQGGRLLEFVGKKGVDLSIPVKDPAIVADLKARAAAAGKDGKLFDTDDTKLREYVHGLVDKDFHPKDFRTLRATRLAMDLVNKGKVPKTEREYKIAVRGVAKEVSKALGNTPTIALKSYINPMVFAKWRIVK